MKKKLCGFNTLGSFLFCQYFSFFITTEDGASVTNCDSVKFQSGSSEGEGSNAGTASGTKENALTIQPALSSSDKDELMAKLYDDEESMMLQFGSLVTKTCSSIQERIPIDVPYSGKFSLVQIFE